MNEKVDENSMEFWRTKCMKMEKVIKTLSNHCVRVVEHHEDLLIKFMKNQDQYEKLKAKCKERGEQIKQARQVLIPVSNELKLLREKYETAVQCQVKAESFAIETTTKNKKLNRQSHMLMANLGSMNITDIDINDDMSQEEEEEKKYIEKLGQQIDELENEKIALSIQVKELAESVEDEKESKEYLIRKIDIMKEELQKTKATVKHQEELLEKVAATSEKVYKEYQDMEQTCRKEFRVRNEAERVAQRLFTERDQARRESAMALGKVADNRKLMDAMLEIQELNAKSAEMKDDFARKILELEEQVKAAKEVYNAENLEAENEELNVEKNTLQEKLDHSEAEMAQLHTKYEDLLATYKTLEIKFEKATAIPPPPPPPAPPPPSTSKVGGFLQRIVGRKGQRERAKECLTKGGVALSENHSKAVDEMMQRIKSGSIGLRPVLHSRTQSLPEKDNQPSAMNELQGLLTKMKKSKSEDEISVFEETGVDEESELGKMLKKRRQLYQEKVVPRAEAQIDTRPVPMPRKMSTILDDAEEG